MFNPSVIKLTTLCNAIIDLPIKIELYSDDNGTELFYGSC